MDGGLMRRRTVVLCALLGALAVEAAPPEAQGWRAEVVTRGLEHPWAIAWLPDGTALISERPGRLRRLATDGRLDPRPIEGVPEVLAEGQGGLLDVAPHPDFRRNRLVYLSYAEGTARANRTALARARLVDGALRDLERLYANPDTKRDTQHFGSRILWLDDDSLLLSIGDGGNPPIRFAGGLIREQAQRLDSHFGKILRLRADGSPHPDNPWFAAGGARAAIHSLGHRNIQGLARDPASGRVWANEHGARGGDELNRIIPGANYGWPEVTTSHEYWGPAISSVHQRVDVTAPLLEWTPSKAPSGLAYYSGRHFPAWRGDLFSGALKFGEVRRIDLEDGAVVGEERLTIGTRVRDVREGPDGHLYVLTDAPDGALLRIVPDG